MCQIIPLLSVLLWIGVGSCSLVCPDGTLCSDFNTCCLTKNGYSCCHYPNAICCADLAHCCPSGFQCNSAAQVCERADKSWAVVPMRKKVAAVKPRAPVLSLTPLLRPDRGSVQARVDKAESSVVHCDDRTVCPDGMTCCRYTYGWSCCPYSPGTCCLDGFHCCPWGYNCDPTYTHCVRQGLRYPFTQRKALAAVPASPMFTLKAARLEAPMAVVAENQASGPRSGPIRCDDKFYCPPSTSCCKGPTGQWGCCPYQLGTCCSDGVHCCQYGYTCDSTSLMCNNGFTQIPSGPREQAKEV